MENPIRKENTQETAGAERLAELRRRLPAWYEKHRRDLPWRKTGEPYDVWLSEIICQQTRIGAAVGYYQRFRKELPDAAALAACPEDRLMKLWEGLGYYSRARNLQKAARIVADQYGGKVPETAEELKKLPGIGEYTAGAIASIAYGEAVPAVDGNVLRVCARLTGSRADISRQQTKRALREALERELKAAKLEGVHPGIFNQALMELGALVCLPNGKPLCGSCPLSAVCLARERGSQEELPVKAPKAGRKIEKKTLLVIQAGSRYFIRKRPAGGLLAGLYEFPSLDGFADREKALAFVREMGLDPLSIHPLPGGKHIFTHKEWHMHAWRIGCAEDPGISAAGVSAGGIFADAEEIRVKYSVPSAFSFCMKEIC